MEINNIKAVVFDCDGVMFDTSEGNKKFYDEILAHFKKPSLTREQFINVHMMTVKDAIEYLFPELDDLFPIYECMKNIGYKKFIQYMKMEKGLKSLLFSLKENGFIRGVATNRTNTMEFVLKEYHLEDYFEVVVTAADVKKAKPDPEQLEQIQDKYSLKPDQILFIGDSEFDQMAASGAGTWFIAFKNPTLKADLHVESMDEIARFLGIN